MSLNACGCSFASLPFENNAVFGLVGSAMFREAPLADEYTKITPSDRDQTYEPANCQRLESRLVRANSTPRYVIVPGIVCRRNASLPKKAGSTLYIVIGRSSDVFAKLSGPESFSVTGAY